jgi:hypothetical protein
MSAPSLDQLDDDADADLILRHHLPVQRAFLDGAFHPLTQIARIRCRQRSLGFFASRDLELRLSKLVDQRAIQLSRVPLARISHLDVGTLGLRSVSP